MLFHVDGRRTSDSMHVEDDFLYFLSVILNSNTTITYSIGLLSASIYMQNLGDEQRWQDWEHRKVLVWILATILPRSAPAARGSVTQGFDVHRDDLQGYCLLVDASSALHCCQRVVYIDGPRYNPTLERHPLSWPLIQQVSFSEHHGRCPAVCTK